MFHRRKPRENHEHATITFAIEIWSKFGRFSEEEKKLMWQDIDLFGAMTVH